MKKFLSFLLVVIVTFIGVITVKAEDYKIVANVNDSTLKMTVEGTFDFTNYAYFVWFANENDQAPALGNVDNTNDSIIGNWHYFFENSTDKSVEIPIKDDWYLLKGYDYAYIQKRNRETDEYSLVASKIKIERPSLPSNKKRYSFSSVHDGLLSRYIDFPYIGKTGNHKLYTKIGKITDTSLLREYSNNKFDNLFTYAKNDKNGKLTSCTFGISNDDCYGNNSNYKLSGIEAGSYYYVYFYMDDPLYRDVSSVLIAEGIEGSDNEPNYIHYIENIDNATDKTVYTGDVVANPKTADFKIIFIVSLVIITILVSIIGRKKLAKIVKK